MDNGSFPPLDLAHKHETNKERFRCSTCLMVVARYIARALGFSVAAAEEHDAAWYQAEVGSDVCSLECAADLRTMVIVACRIGEN